MQSQRQANPRGPGTSKHSAAAPASAHILIVQHRGDDSSSTLVITMQRFNSVQARSCRIRACCRQLRARTARALKKAGSALCDSRLRCV